MALAYSASPFRGMQLTGAEQCNSCATWVHHLHLQTDWSSM